MKLLNIYGTFLRQSLDYGGLVELLTCPKFLNDTSLLKLALELLQCSLDVLTFFYRYYNHCLLFKC